MSDSENKIDQIEQKQEEILIIIDDLKTISISDEKSPTLEINDVKTIEDESYDENDSEYEDVEEDESDEINKSSILTSITNKNPSKTNVDDDEIRINVKPRRINKKHEDDEQSEGYEDDDDNDNQNVPKIIKTKKLLDDDNNTSSPAYIPRKGKYYEHDDRTLDENIQPQQEISKNKNRFYTDSDGKWPHDLFLRDEQISKPRYVIPRRDHGHFERRNNYNREQFHLNDYMPRSQKVRNDYQQQQEYSNDYRRRVPYEPTNKSNNFDFKDYNRPLSYNRDSYNKDTNIRKETQRRDYDSHQIDERTFHRRRNFTNSQFQQQDNNLTYRNDQKQFNGNNQYRNFGEKNQQDNHIFKKYEFNENKNNLPPRLQLNNNYQKQTYQQNSISNNERPKRYSNMRNNMITPIQQHSNNIEQNDWPQAPPPPTSYLPQQISTSQIYYQQQTSRYVPLNYPQTSISEQFQDKK